MHRIGLGGDANQKRDWAKPSSRRTTKTNVFRQVRHVWLAPLSQALAHLQPTKQAHLLPRKPDQGLATQPNTPKMILCKPSQGTKHINSNPGLCSPCNQTSVCWPDGTMPSLHRIQSLARLQQSQVTKQTLTSDSLCPRSGFTASLLPPSADLAGLGQQGPPTIQKCSSKPRAPWPLLASHTLSTRPSQTAWSKCPNAQGLDHSMQQDQD